MCRLEPPTLLDDLAEDALHERPIEGRLANCDQPIHELLFASWVVNLERARALLLAHFEHEPDPCFEQGEELPIDSIDLGTQAADLHVVDHGPMLHGFGDHGEPSTAPGQRKAEETGG